MAERDRGQPVNADVNVGRAFLPSGDLQVFPFRCAAADKYRVVIFSENFFKARNVFIKMSMDPQVENIIYLFIQHRLR